MRQARAAAAGLAASVARAGALPPTTDVVVAGAGVAGSALAFELSRRGVATVLLDRSPAGPAGASTVPAALINPHRGRTARAAPADLLGAQAFWRMTRDLEDLVGVSGAYRTGVLRVADNARQARNWQKVIGTQWLEPAEVPAPYHAPFGALLVAGGGWIDARTLLAALATGATQGPVDVRWGLELVGVADDGGPCAVVRTAPGAETSKIRCGTVVIATGADRPEGLELPRLELVWGEARVLDLGFTPPLPLAGAVVAAFRDGLAFVSGGHRHVGWLGRSRDARDEAGVTESAGEPTEDGDGPQLRSALAWHLPAAAAAPELSRWQGVRAKRASGEPVVRRLRPGLHLMAAFGGRGFLRAALAAERLADELATRLK